MYQKTQQTICTETDKKKEILIYGTGSYQIQET